MNSRWEIAWKFPLLVILGLGVLLLSACGGGESGEATATIEPADTATSTVEAVVTDIVTPPSETPDTPENTPGSTAKPTIISPVEGAAVPVENRVDIIVAPDVLGEKTLHVLVRPIPNDPNQDFWVQALPGQVGDGQWASSPVFVGIATDPSGLEFKICAVITNDRLSRGERLRALPTGESHCVSVTRQ